MPSDRAAAPPRRSHAYLAGSTIAVEAGAADARRASTTLNLFYFGRAPRVRVPMLHQSYATARTPSTRSSGALEWEQAVGEARRCLSCGLCTECDNCYVFCPDAAIIANRADGGYAID